MGYYIMLALYYIIFDYTLLAKRRRSGCAEAEGPPRGRMRPYAGRVCYIISYDTMLNYDILY